MFRNFIQIAIRNLWKHKAFSAISIVGLALGLVTCLLIVLFIRDELSYGRFHVHADQIYRINADIDVNGTVFKDRVTPAALGPALRHDFPEIAEVARIKREGKVTVRRGDKTLIASDCFWADSTLFDVFTLPMVAGDPRTALIEPHTIVLSASTAVRIFNRTDVVGTTLDLEGTPYRITGVIRDMPAQSHVHFNLIKAMSGFQPSRSDFWLNNNFDTYVLVRPGTHREDIEKDLQQEVKRHVEPQLQGYIHSSLQDIGEAGGHYRFTAMPLTKIHLYSTLTSELEPTGSIHTLYLFMGIAFLILLVAGVNFTNLSTAGAMRRSKEVGIRKVLGSRRSGLIYQFLSESVMASLLAMLLAVLIAGILLPYFNQMSGKAIPFSAVVAPGIIGLWLGITVGVGLLAGVYPSVVLSSFAPVRALKGKWSGGNRGNRLKNGLVVFQFATAMILIVGTLMIYTQLHYIQHKKLGYDRAHVLVIDDLYALGSHAASFKHEVLQMPGVEAATMAGTFPTSLIYDREAFSQSAAGDAHQTAILGHWEVDEDYMPTLKMTMVRGRNFSSQMPTDSSALIINQTAARMLGLTDPLDKTLYLKGSDHTSYPVHIIGVVKDFNTGSLRNQIAPLAFSLADNPGRMAIRVHTDRLAAVIDQIKIKYQQIATLRGQPFVYSFMDDDFDHLYRSEQRMGLLFIYFACFAIGIACLGLFGLVTFSVEQRTKEIGVRRVLGATVPGLVALLSRDFLKLVGISIILAVPAAWWGMHVWLQGFAYRTTLHGWIFLVAGVLVTLIAFGTVGAKAARAAMANPVKSLRTE